MAISINKQECIGCLTCTKVCPVAYLENKKGKPGINENIKCLQCLHCISACKCEAIFSDNPLIKKNPLSEVKSTLRRRSHRQYKNTSLDNEIITTLINEANTAPAMGGYRDARLFTVVSNRKTIKGLREEILKTIKKYIKLFNILRKLFFFNSKMKKNFENLYRIFSMQYKENQKKDMLFRDAPHLLLVSSPKTVSGGKDNCLYAMGSFLIAAEEYNIGTCLVGFLSGFHKEVSKYLNLPKDHIIHAGIVFGYPELFFPFKAFRTDAKINFL